MTLETNTTGDPKPPTVSAPSTAQTAGTILVVISDYPDVPGSSHKLPCSAAGKRENDRLSSSEDDLMQG